MTSDSTLVKPIVLHKPKSSVTSTADITLHEELAQDYVESLFAFSGDETLKATIT